MEPQNQYDAKYIARFLPRAVLGRKGNGALRWRGRQAWRDAMDTVKTLAETQLSKGPFRAARGTEISCKGWQQEAALRMLMNNLDPEVAEKPEELVVYGGTGKAARNWECFHAIVRSLKALEADETLLVQSGKPVGIFRTHEYAPRVLLCNSNLVGHWNNWDRFHELDRAGLMMYGQ